MAASSAVGAVVDSGSSGGAIAPGGGGGTPVAGALGGMGVAAGVGRVMGNARLDLSGTRAALVIPVAANGGGRVRVSARPADAGIASVSLTVKQRPGGSGPAVDFGTARTISLATVGGGSVVIDRDEAGGVEEVEVEYLRGGGSTLTGKWAEVEWSVDVGG